MGLYWSTVGWSLKWQECWRIAGLLPHHTHLHRHATPLPLRPLSSRCIPSRPPWYWLTPLLADWSAFPLNLLRLAWLSSWPTKMADRLTDRQSTLTGCLYWLRQKVNHKGKTGKKYNKKATTTGGQNVFFLQHLLTDWLTNSLTSLAYLTGWLFWLKPTHSTVPQLMIYMRVANMILCVVLAATAFSKLLFSGVDVSGGVLACYLLWVFMMYICGYNKCYPRWPSPFSKKRRLFAG